jgi:hypothetical protein
VVAVVCEGPVEHHGDDVGVVPEVDQLVGRVAVVGVDRGEPGLERPERALEVLGRVVEVLRDLVLLDRARVEQRCGDAVGATVELRPGRGPIALALRGSVGDLRRDALPDVGEVPSTVGHAVGR